MLGAHLGTVVFAVPAESSTAFAELMIRLHENGLTRVTFFQRDVPAAIVVRS